jgi:hypothetical protein
MYPELSIVLDLQIKQKKSVELQKRTKVPPGLIKIGFPVWSGHINRRDNSYKAVA